jgi:signal peptidase I
VARPTPANASASRRARDAEAPSDDARRRDVPEKGLVRQWGEALIFAVIVVVIVRTFFFDLFRIPTPSMEKNLLVGDYLFVSKLHYGTRTPMTLGVPFLPWHVPGIEFPYARLPGFGTVERGDPIVFNYPPDDAPTDRKQHYIKRVIGLPGETLSVRDKVVHIDEQPLPLGEGMQQAWLVHKQDPRYRLSSAGLREMGISYAEPTRDPSIVQIRATQAAVAKVSGWPWVEKVEPAFSRPARPLYPAGRDYTPDRYGPISIPAKGQTVTLSAETWPVFGPVINRYEGHAARQLTDSTFAIDGEVTNRYTFRQDYYFVMGDNRDNSEDSRFWGFVPFDHVVGKAILTYFSWDKSASPFIVGQVRYGRLFRPIQDGSVLEGEVKPVSAAATPLPTKEPTDAARREEPVAASK